MATKQVWLDHLKDISQWVKDMRKWLKKQPDGEIAIPEEGEVTTQSDPPRDPPPIKPPNP